MSEERRFFINKDALFVPKWENNREKRQNIKTLRQSRRQEVKAAETREERQQIRDNYQSQIREQRGGITQFREIIEDTKDFVNQVNELKDNIQNTTVGKVFNLSKNVLKNIATQNYQGLINNAQSVHSLVQGRGSSAQNNSSNSDKCL